MRRPFNYEPQDDDKLLEDAVAHVMSGDNIDNLGEASLIAAYREEHFETQEAADLWQATILQCDITLEKFLLTQLTELHTNETLDLTTWDYNKQFDEYQDAMMIAQEEAQDIRRFG